MRNVMTMGLLIFLLCTGCASLMEKAGQTLDGSAFAYKKTAVYRCDTMEIREMRSKAGEHSLIITLPKFPTMEIHGSAPDLQGVFHLTSLNYLGGNSHGWNEYRLDLLGSGNLLLGETTAVCSVTGGMEAMEISSGRIRRYDSRIAGTEALTSLRNRRERLCAMAEWLNDDSNPLAAAVSSQKQFAQYWKPLLFPETVTKKRRPPDWLREGDQWSKAEDIRWNTGYTARVFPEFLRNIRDSGTLLRDWEEALDWLYIEYEWERITEQLAQETILSKRK